MTSSVLFAPHSDDEALFASYIIMREKPLVVIVTDGTSHEKKFGISIKQRREESKQAMKILGADVVFLGLTEEELTGYDFFHEQLHYYMEGFLGRFNRIYAPAIQGGHQHHDLISRVATIVFKQNCLYYSTYQKDNLELVGELEVKPTEEEIELKKKALSCYISQLRINPHHFEAVIGKSEYLNLQQESWRA